MKRCFLLICSFLMALCLLISACTPTSNPTGERQCRVVLSESNYYTCTEYVKTITPGSDVEFNLVLSKDYTVGNTSYGDYDVQVSVPDSTNGKRLAKLTLNNVKYSSFVSVEVVEEKIYKVAINPSSVFSCDEPEKFVYAGEDAEFTLLFDGDYTFDSADFEGLTDVVYNVTGLDSDVDENNEREVILTVENIQADTSITVTEKVFEHGYINLQPIEGQAVIAYVLNGGSYKDKNNRGSYYTIIYPLSHFPRPNTAIGTDVLAREGYTLTGWNTAPDGSGTHIGLGSRADVRKGQTLVLYAEWKKWADAEFFDYVIIDVADITLLYTARQSDKLSTLDKIVASAQQSGSGNKCVVITGYNGIDNQTLVIPGEIGGLSVAVIATGAFENSENFKTIIFPLAMRYVMDAAFTNCLSITEIYLYDSLWYIDSNSFGSNNRIETLHINAKLPPIYGLNESAQFANKMEMLMEAGPHPKTVIFGSCSTWYGIIAEEFGKATGRTAYNMGVEGDTCTTIQTDIIRQYMNKGDTLIYMCDLGSPYLWGYDVSFDPRNFRMMEFNYDLLTTVNMRDYSSVLSALNEYLIIKNRSTNGGTYEDYYPYITEYGDLTTERNGANPIGEYLLVYRSSLEANRALEATKEIFQSFADIGVDIYYGMSTISDMSIYRLVDAVNDVNDYLLSKFADKELNIPATLIGDLWTSVLPVEYFYEYYRLTRRGAEYFTPMFIELFKRVEH